MSDTHPAFSAFRRREFLKATAAAALLPAWFMEESRSFARPPPPHDANERPGSGSVGCGGDGAQRRQDRGPVASPPATSSRDV